MCLQYILDLPPAPLFCLLPSPLPKIISTGFILLFSHIMHNHIHPHSLFSYAHALPRVPTPRKDFILLPFIFLFSSVCWWSREGFALVLQAWIFLCFNQINSRYLLYHHTPLIFNSSWYSTLYYIHI
jgi:hypothetical protein